MKLNISSSSSFRPLIVNLISSIFKASVYASCQPIFVEPLLPLYSGTLSKSDLQILEMWHTFENFRHLSIASLISRWSATGCSARAFDALSSLNPSRVFLTCTRFPTRRTLQPDDPGQVAFDEEVYDPVFVLSLLALTLSEELSGFDWVEILRSNTLGIAVCALTSRDKGTRMLGSAVLAKAMMALDVSSLLNTSLRPA